MRVLTHAVNRGPAAARATGIAAAHGEYIAFSDAGDVCLAERIESQLAHLNGVPWLVAAPEPLARGV